VVKIASTSESRTITPELIIATADLLQSSQFNDQAVEKPGEITEGTEENLQLGVQDGLAITKQEALLPQRITTLAPEERSYFARLAKFLSVALKGLLIIFFCLYLLGYINIGLR